MTKLTKEEKKMKELGNTFMFVNDYFAIGKGIFSNLDKICGYLRIGIEQSSQLMFFVRYNIAAVSTRVCKR